MQLLRLLRRRPDVMASVAQDIDALLGDLPAATPVDTPEVPGALAAPDRTEVSDGGNVVEPRRDRPLSPSDVRVFISYRRNDNPDAAGRLRDALVNEFGETNVFFDLDTVLYGADFREAIRSFIAGLDALIVLVGDRWEAARLHTVSDFVRMELLEARTQRKLVIPVLLHGAPMPAPDALPPELDWFSYLNAAPLGRDPHFHDDLRRIVKQLRADRPERAS